MTPSERRRRVSDLLGMRVLSATGELLGRVNDVRLSPTAMQRGMGIELVVDGLVVSGRHPGSLLGYDRRPDQGPWLVRSVVRAIHRNAGYLTWSNVRIVEWAEGVVTTNVERLDADLGAPSTAGGSSDVASD